MYVCEQVSPLMVELRASRGQTTVREYCEGFELLRRPREGDGVRVGVEQRAAVAFEPEERFRHQDLRVS